MKIRTIIQTGIYGSPILIGGLFFEKEPFVMSLVILLGCVLLSYNCYCEFRMAQARRRLLGYEKSNQ